MQSQCLKGPDYGGYIESFSVFDSTNLCFFYSHEIAKLLLGHILTFSSYPDSLTNVVSLNFFVDLRLESITTWSTNCTENFIFKSLY